MTETAVKERPILFSGEMVRAILDGRKVQTRRIVKPQPVGDDSDNWFFDVDGFLRRRLSSGVTCAVSGKEFKSLRCPYGIPGDRLWVRETWARIPGMRPSGYFENPKLIGKDYWYKASDCIPTWGGKWKPSIHMPRSASRITLEITDVRVQRLQDISEEDAIAEGVDEMLWLPGDRGSYVASFANLWYEINGEGSWESNPWVWAVSFHKLETEQ